MDKNDEQGPNCERAGCSRRRFLTRMRGGVIGFSLYSVAPSIFTLNLAGCRTKQPEQPEQPEGKPDKPGPEILPEAELADDLQFYDLVRGPGSSAPLYLTLDIEPFVGLDRRLGTGGEAPLSKRELLDLVRQAAELKVLKLTFLGAQPFANPALIEIIEAAEAANVSTAAVSGGGDLDDEQIEALTKITNFDLKFNLYSADPSKHDGFWGASSFKATVDTISRCVAKGIHTTVVTYATRENVEDIEGVVELCAKLKVDVYNLRRYIAVDEGDEKGRSLEISAEQGRQLIDLQGGLLAKARQSVALVGVDPFGGHHTDFVRFGVMSQREAPMAWNTMCQAAATYCHISSTGKVVPCTWMPLECGDLRRQPLAEIWRSSEVFESLRHRESYDECIAHSLLKTGNSLAEDPIKWPV